MLPDQENGLPELTEEEEVTQRLHQRLTDTEIETGLRTRRSQECAFQASRCRTVLVSAAVAAAVVSVAALVRPSSQPKGPSVSLSGLSQLDDASKESSSNTNDEEALPFIYDPANGKALFPRVTPELDAARNVDAELQPGTMFEATHVVQNPDTHMLFAAMVDDKGYVPLWIPSIGEMARRITKEEASDGSKSIKPDETDESLADEVQDLPNITTTTPNASLVASTKAPGEPLCTDMPPDWSDIDQSTCAEYAKYCNPDGSTNEKWDPEWGTFKENIGALGTSADQACCACGGGSLALIPTTTNTTTTSTTTTETNTTTQTTTNTTTATTTTNTTTMTTTAPAEVTDNTTASEPTSAPTSAPEDAADTSSSTTAGAIAATASATTATTAASTTLPASGCDGCLLNDEVGTCFDCSGSPSLTKTECDSFEGEWQLSTTSCATER